MACYYKAMGKFRVSLKFLEESLKIEKELDSKQNTSDILLNICAVLSKLGRHKDALDSILNSVYLMQEDILQVSLTTLFETKQKNEEISRFSSINQNKSTNQDEFSYLTKYERSILLNLENTTIEQKRSFVLERISILAIAFHNMGVEFEHLKMKKEALSVFEKGLSLSEQYLGENSGLTEKLEKISSELRSELKLPERIKKSAIIEKFQQKSDFSEKSLINQSLSNYDKNQNSDDSKSDLTHSKMTPDKIESASFESIVKEKSEKVNNESLEIKSEKDNQIRKKSKPYRISSKNQKIKESDKSGEFLEKLPQNLDNSSFDQKDVFNSNKFNFVKFKNLKDLHSKEEILHSEEKSSDNSKSLNKEINNCIQKDSINKFQKKKQSEIQNENKNSEKNKENLDFKDFAKSEILEKSLKNCKKENESDFDSKQFEEESNKNVQNKKVSFFGYDPITFFAKKSHDSDKNEKNSDEEEASSKNLQEIAKLNKKTNEFDRVRKIDHKNEKTKKNQYNETLSDFDENSAKLTNYIDLNEQIRMTRKSKKTTESESVLNRNNLIENIKDQSWQRDLSINSENSMY